MSYVVHPAYDHYNNLPNDLSLVNVLEDAPAHLREKDELIEFYKMSNEWYSPEFGIKYLLRVNLYPFQMAAIRAILGHKFPMLLFTRGGGKTFLLAVYAIYHAMMFPNSRIILVSASFRQSKLIFAEIDRIYRNSPLLSSVSDDQPRISTDHCHYKLCGSVIKALPLGTGDKIRGERGHVILADEFNSIPIEVFDVVVRGFGATQIDPWKKTRDIMIKRHEEEQAAVGAKTDKHMAEAMLADGNKIVLSGTAGFKNGTFYKLYKQYSKIISNGVRGNISEFDDIFEEDKFSDDIDIDCSDYCILRLTYKDLPAGMQDTKLIEGAKATMPGPLFEMEYLAKFADDTLGYFKQRDIDSATSRYPDGFPITLKGSAGRHYVLGVDPARTTDRFAITVIELGQPNKIVSCWTCRNRPFSYASAKIREYMRNFNVIAIAMDEGGGGLAVEELINKSDVMKSGDAKVIRYDNDEMNVEGSKILYMFNFNSNWIDEANALLQKNIEDKVIMFPMAVDRGSDFSKQKDDVLYEILEMKKELVSIEVTHTKTGKKHFDLAPPDPRKDIDGVVRHKDRYSALLLANYICSRLTSLSYDKLEETKNKFYKSVSFGGWADQIRKSD